MPRRDRRLHVLRGLWRSLPAPLRRSLRPVLRRSLPNAETEPVLLVLSVVIPMYNVARYLDECLASVAAQAVSRMEVIIVDDGSTDDSVAIAERYVRADERFVIISQANAGLGAARNRGIARARGEFIAFADSDDIIPADAYQILLDALGRSGSEFAVGSVKRLAGDRRILRTWAAEVHRTERLGITIDQFPEALQDVFAWNKMLRRSFWDTHIGGFPEGRLYEDQEVSGKAYLRAAKFDVLTDVVYEWRIRSDGSSITQQKSSIADLRDRLAVLDDVSVLMEAEAAPIVRSHWLAKVLGFDLLPYYQQIPRVGSQYWEELRLGVAALAAVAGEQVLIRMPVHERLLVHLIVEGRREDTETLLVELAERGAAVPLVRDAEILKARPAYTALLRQPVPEHILAVPTEQLRLQTQLSAIRPGTERRIEIEGYAYVPGIGMDCHASELTVLLRPVGGGAPLILAVERFNDPAIDRASGDTWSSYAGSAFRTVVDLDTLEQYDDGGRDPSADEWVLEMSLEIEEVTVAAPFSGRDRSGTAARLPLVPANGDHRYLCRFDDDHGLSFRRAAVNWRVSKLELSGRRLELAVCVPDSQSAESLLLECPRYGLSIAVAPLPGTTQDAEFAVDLPDLPSPGVGESPHKPSWWRLRARAGDGKLRYLAWPGSDTQLRKSFPEDLLLRAATNGSGNVVLKESRSVVIADAVETTTDGTGVTVTGRALFSPEVSWPVMVLTGNSRSIHPSNFNHEPDGKFTVEFPLAQLSWNGAVDAPESGRYALRSLFAKSGADAGGYPVPLSARLESTLPGEMNLPAANIDLGRSALAANLIFRFGPPLLEEERGKLSQQRLKQSIPLRRRSTVIAGATLFESFGGRSASDNGLALHQELVRRGDDRPKYWVVKDHSVAVPRGALRVVQYSRQWYELVHRAEFLVNNTIFASSFRKNPAQTYVQTWHGTPLKRTGHDGPTSYLSLPRLAALQREASYWDVLLAQNEYAENILPQALNYAGDILTAGYPRNDALFAPDACERRQSLREQLGIAEDQTAVLYAPTWRDNVSDFTKPHGHIDFLDVQQARRRLGDSYVFLFRGHQDMGTAGRKEAVGYLSDVTFFPDINELYLAADILVTDYSSVMFDFCITGKPIYFLATDLDAFRDGPRGFYLDYEALAPGPIARSTEELVSAIAEGADGRLDRAYASFRQRFAANDDGTASQRVVDVVWGMS